MARFRFNCLRLLTIVTVGCVVIAAIKGIPNSFAAPFFAPELIGVAILAVILAALYQMNGLMSQ